MHQDQDRKKFWLKILISATVIAILVVVALATLPGFIGEKVKGIVVDEINRNLLVPVGIEQIEFTLLSSFPDASVVFRNVEMKPAPGNPEVPGLIHARSISLKFGIFSLFTNNYKIQSISIDEASVSLWKDSDGITNFDIWKKSTGAEKNHVNFDLQQIRLRNTSVYYRDITSAFDLAVSFPEMVIKGKITGKLYEFRMDGKLLAERIIVNNQNYTPASEIEIKSYARVDDALKSVFIESANVSTTGMALELEGMIGYGDKNMPVDLKFSSHKSDIEDITKFLPDILSHAFRIYEPAGSVRFNGSVKGTLSKNKYPELSAKFRVEKGNLLYKETNTRLTNLALTGTFKMPSAKFQEKLVLNKISFNTAKGKYSGNLVIEDFSKLLASLDLSAKTDLEELFGLLPDSGIEKLTGQVIADIKLKGSFAGKNKKIETASGLITLSNTNFVIKDNQKEIKNINGRFELNNGSVMIEQLSLQKGESDFNISGAFNNLVGYLSSEKSNLVFDVKVNSQKIRIEDILTHGKNSGANDQGSMFPERISFDAELNCGKLIYQKFSAENITGKLNLKDNVLRVGDLSFNSSDGKVVASGLVNGRYKNHAQVICNAKLTHVDISRMFYEFENFGQSSLQSKHLRGRGDATIQYSSTLNNRFETDASSVTAIADVEIRNGELLNFEPMQELSRFLDAQELKNIKFSTLKNRIEVAEKTVIIPAMEIKSSVMDLKGYGSHTFGNEIDYHLNLALADLKKNRKRREAAPVDSYTTGNQGETRLFLHLYGTVDDPEVRYDSQAVSKKIADDFKNQKQELRQIIREEFGKTKTQTTTEKQKTTTKFDIEWDEE
ncbi:MAG: AsmA family protein [Lentimicrobium sp.]|nr:AsmA family protein [Lentimicrobium sp.]